MRLVKSARNVALWVLLFWVFFAILAYCSGAARTRLEAMHYALQLFFAGIDFDKPDVSSLPLRFSAYIAPWLLFIIGAMTFVRALRVWATLWFKALFQRVGSSGPLVFVVGLGDKGISLIRAERGRNPDISLVALEIDPNNPNIIEAETLGAIVWIGNALSETDLMLCCWHRPERVFAVTDSDRINLIVLDKMRSIYRETTIHNEKTDVYAHVAEQRDLRLASDLSVLNSDTPCLWTHLFNMQEDTAAYLLHKHPVLPDEAGLPRILLIGPGLLMACVFRELLRQAHFMRQGMPGVVTIGGPLDLDAEIVAHSVKWQPHGDVPDWNYREYLRIREDKPFSHIFVLLDSEIQNLSLLDKVAAWECLAREANAASCHQNKHCELVGVAQEAVTANWRTSSLLGTSVFSLDEVYSWEAIQWREEIEKLAMAVDACYDQIFKEENPILSNQQNPHCSFIPVSNDKNYYVGVMDTKSKSEEEKAKNWATKVEYDRRSSLAQARHIEIKLCELGYAISSCGPDSQSQLEQVTLSNLAGLAECEHRRWNTAQFLDGCVVVDSPLSKTTAYKKSHKYAKVHEDLVAFDNLDERVRGIDFALTLNIPGIIESAGLHVTDISSAQKTP